MQKKITKEKLEKIVPDWHVWFCEDDGTFELTRHSPAGEEIVVDLSGDTLQEMSESASSYYDNFDPDDHAATIYHAKNHGTEEDRRFYASAPYSLEALINDAKAIDNMYYELYVALRDAEQE